VADGDVSLRYRLLGSDEGASRAFDKVGKSSDHLSTRMVAVGTAIGHLAAGGLLALGGMAAGAVKTGIQTAAAMQQAQLGFATLLGSEKAAGDYMKWLTGFAASTPFEMKGLVESSRTLIGVGVSAKDAKVMLQNFGDTASAVGIDQDAFQRVMLATSQAISAGKFQAGDLNQIMTNGIPVWTILSKAMHKSVPELRDLASHGKLLAKDVLPALQAEMHKDYGGAMAKQSQTLNGLWSTFQDTIHLGMANVLKPLIPIMQKYLPGAMNTAGAAFTTAATAVDRFVNGGGLQTMSSVIKNDVVPSLKFIGDHKDVFLALAASATAGVAAYKAYTGVMGLFAAVTTAAAIAQKLYAVATREATVAQVGLDVAMDANPIGLIVGAIAALVIGLIALGVWLYGIASRSETFRNAMSAAFNAVKGVVVGAIGQIVTVFHAVASAWDAFVGGFQNPDATIGKSVGTITAIFLTLGATVGTVVGWFRAIPGEIAAAWNAIPALLGTVASWFAALPGMILAGLVALPGLLLDLLKTMLEKAAFAVGFSLGMLVNLFVIWPAKVGLALTSLPGIVLHWITTTGLQATLALGSFLGGCLTKIGSWLVDVGIWFAKLPGVIVHWITTTGVQSALAFVNFHVMLMEKAYALTSAMVSWVAAMVPRVVAWFERLPGMAVAAIQALPGLIKGVFASAKTWLLDAGKQIVMGLVDGIKSAAGHAMSAVKDLAGNIVGGFQSALSINSPSKVMADQVGVSIPEGIALGMNDGAHHIATAAARLVPTTPGAYGVGATGGRGGGGGDTHIHVHMQSGFVGSSDQLATAMSDVITRAKARGLNLSFA
jgi:tape measure domain-containing protein